MKCKHKEWEHIDLVKIGDDCEICDYYKKIEEIIQPAFWTWLEKNSKRDSDKNLVVDGYEFDKKAKELRI